MSYTTKDEIAFVFEGKKSIDSTDKDKMAKVRDRYADPIINAKLSTTHNVPFKDHPDTPEIITTISTWMSAYLYQVIPSQTSSQEWLETLWERAMMFLTALAEGDMTIPELQNAVDENGDEFVFNRLKSEADYDGHVFHGRHELPVFGNADANIPGKDPH